MSNRLLTFTGPSGRTYFDRDGVLQTAGEDEIREEYDPLTGAYLGMLIEPQERANYMPLSEDFLSYSRNYGGTEHYSKIQIDRFPRHFTLFKPTYVEDPGSSSRSLGLFNYSESVNDSGEEWTLSLFVKPINSNSSERAPLYIQLHKEGLPNGVFFNLRDLTVSGNYESAGFIDCGNGVYRIWATQKSITTDSSSYTFINFANRTSRNSFDPYPTGDEQVAFTGFQVEKGPLSTYIFTTGSPVTLPGEDARFTDPAVFNDLERGGFLVTYKTKRVDPDAANNYVLNRGSTARLLALSPSRGAYTYDGSHVRTSVDGAGFGSGRHIYAISFEGKHQLFCVDGTTPQKFPWNGTWGNGDLILGGRQSWAGYIKALDFSPEPYTPVEARQLTKLDAATVIGECPNGGVYRYGPGTCFVESDASGIPVEERTYARLGDPVGAVLDLSGHGNHLTASTDVKRGLLKSDGVIYWIEKTEGNIYGFQFSAERTVTFIEGITNNDDKVIGISDTDGGGGVAYARIYQRGSGTSRFEDRWPIRELKSYFNGTFQPVTNRGDTYRNLTEVCLYRTLHEITGQMPNKVYLNGYTDQGWGFEGKSYGFAWASRLSEDDALIVEAEMRRNMPPIR